MVFVWGGLGIFIFLFSRILEESPRWYENQGRLDEADKALDRIEANSKAEFGSLPPVTEASKPPSPPGKFADVFARAYLARTSMLVGVYVFQTLGIFGFLSWVPTLLANHGFKLSNSLFSVTMMDVGAPVGALIAVFISDRWERKYMIMIASLVIAFFGVMYGLSSKMALIVIFGFCVMMFIQAFAPLLYAYTPECFPTAIRSSGSGVAYGAGRLANSFGPMIVAFLFTHYGYKSVFVYIVATWLLVAFIVAAFGPKTKGQTLA
jgi:MFS transporter, putative metabolite:H+ symporter